MTAASISRSMSARISASSWTLVFVATWAPLACRLDLPPGRRWPSKMRDAGETVNW